MLKDKTIENRSTNMHNNMDVLIQIIDNVQVLLANRFQTNFSKVDGWRPWKNKVAMVANV